MIVSSKTIEVVRDKDNKPTDKVRFLVSLYPNHYNLPVSEAAYHQAEVCEDMEISFTLVEKPNEESGL